MSGETRRMLFIFLNVFLFAVIVWSFIVNTHSLMNPYALLSISSLPAFIAAGAALLVLRTWYPVSIANALLPFAAIVVFLAPHVLPPSMLVSFASNLLAVGLLVAAPVMVVNNLRSAGG
ncbi:MAG: hypothetical protein ACNS63_05860 [Candidatus Nitrospinota bacterium M3_3B_026]